MVQIQTAATAQTYLKRDMINGGIFGPKLSGKTTLAKAISRQYWSGRQMRSLVLDPHGEDWGKQALVVSLPDDDEKAAAEEARFWGMVWKTRNCLIIVEEAAATIRRDRGLVPVFTRLRHCNHRLLVIGHSGMDLLPVMRQQFDTLYLFCQPDEACKIWAQTFCDKGLYEAADLQQYEFIFKEMYKPHKRLRLPSPSASHVPA